MLATDRKGKLFIAYTGYDGMAGGALKSYAGVVSSDDGATWPRDESLVVHTHDERAKLSQGKEDIDFKQYWEDMGKWSFGHPAIRSLGGGDVLLAYYAGTPDRMSIYWARVSC